MNNLLITFPMDVSVLPTEAATYHIVSSSQNLTIEQVIQQATELQASALMVSHQQPMTADVINRLPESVRVIATSSVGFEHFDLAAAKAKHILMTNTPDVLTDSTADLAFLLMLSACRRLKEYQDIMQAGWGHKFAQNEMLGIRPQGKTLGILGMGRIGQAMADRARAFGMNIIYFNRQRLPVHLEKGATYFSDFKEMLPYCHFLSLHAPANSQTLNIMNEETFALLPKDAIFVNVARGSMVVEDALIAALQSGHLFAAGLDVFQKEPDFDRRLASLSNVILSPHMASATRETRADMWRRAFTNIDAALNGRTPQDLL